MSSLYILVISTTVENSYAELRSNNFQYCGNTFTESRKCYYPQLAEIVRNCLENSFIHYLVISKCIGKSQTESRKIVISTCHNCGGISYQSQTKARTKEPEKLRIWRVEREREGPEHLGWLGDFFRKKKTKPSRWRGDWDVLKKTTQYPCKQITTQIPYSTCFHLL